jgi:hypothetical protein
MKKYLIIACAALAFVGCARNEHRGGMPDSSNSQTGSELDRSTQSTTNSSSYTNNTNGTQGNPSGTTSGSTSDRSSGAGSEK